MASHVPFTDNVQDLSSDKGYQFKFCCERCGNGYLSAYEPNYVNVAGGALQMASGLLGGLFQRAATSAHDVARLVGGPAHDAAMRAAVEEVAPNFNQCKRCGQWVCRPVCWNGERSQCVRCSPKMDQELAAIESEGTLYQLRSKIYDGSVDLTGGAVLESAAAGQASVATSRACGCGTQIPRGAKFCSGCGQPAALKRTCSACGVESAAGAMFCAECGHRLDA